MSNYILNANVDLKSQKNIIMNRIGQLSIRNLELLVKLSKLNSIQDTAHAMYITQSTATKSLQKIEEIFNSELFSRSNYGLSITDEGLIVVDMAQKILHQLSRAEREVRNIQNGISGELLLGIPTGASAAALHQAIIKSKAQWPNISIIVKEANNADLMFKLVHSQLDLIIGHHWRPIDVPMINFIPIYEEVFCLCVRPTHPVTKQQKLSLGSLLDYDWILPPPKMSLRNQIEDSFYEDGLPLPNNYIESSMLMSNSQLLTNSDVISIWPFQSIRDKYLSGEIIILPIGLPKTINQIGISMRHEPNTSSSLAYLIENLVSIGHTITAERSEWRTIFHF